MALAHAAPVLARLALLAALLAPASLQGAVPDSASTVARLRREADALRPLVRSRLARRFLEATALLPPIAPREVLHDSARGRYWTRAESETLPAILRSRLIARVVDEEVYYLTRYGSPLAYVRPLELAAAAGLGDLAGRRVADFGYGTIGHLRLLGFLGADVHGIEVDPFLRTLYAPDTGAVPGARGRLVLHHGRWPGDPGIAAEVGGGYDLFLSKNTLKNGYIHPAEKVDPRMLVSLGVADSGFVAALARAVKPGGLVMIYNLSPAPAPPGKPYIPWADGRCPFASELWRAAGFEVLAFDRDDSRAARRMGQALGWDRGERPMDLEKDLFATYSLFRRRR